MDYKEKAARSRNKTLEFMWRSSQSLGSNSDIFTYIMDSHYCTPTEIDYVSKQVNADARLPTQAVDIGSQADAFAAMARGRSGNFRTPNLLLPFGCDFQHQNAIHDYVNMDR